MKLISVNEDFVSVMTLLGEEDKPSVAVKETLERLVCSLYQVKHEIDVNEARYKTFTKRKKPPPPQPLPLTKDALYLHIERANYQCQLWKKALDYHSQLPHPVEHGWINIDGSLAVQWGHLKPAQIPFLNLFLAAAKNPNAPQTIAVVHLLIAMYGFMLCTNCKNKDSQERVDFNKIFNDDDDFGEYQDGDTDGEPDGKDSSEDELYEDDEIDNN